MFGVTPVSVRTVLVALACGLPASWAMASPESSSDPLSRLLAEKGVLEVRDATSDMVVSAMHFLGVPYKRGGNSEAGFDCSGFTRHIYENSLGLLLPRKVDEQAKAAGLAPVKRTELKPGDLVFFNTLRRTFSHVGIYIGGDKFIHAPRPGGEIRVESMGVSYWAKRFTGARRAEQGAAAPSAALVSPAAAPAPTTPAATQAPLTTGFPADIPP